jgi:hypothetical protein
MVSEFGCEFNWSAQHTLGLGNATASASHIGTNRKERCLLGPLTRLERSRIVAKPRRRKAIGCKLLSVRMDGVASTG